MRLCARLLTSSNIILRFKVRGAHIRSIDLRRPRGGPSPFLERSVRLRGAAVHGDILSIWVDDDCRPIVTAISWLHHRRSGTPWQRCLVPPPLVLLLLLLLLLLLVLLLLLRLLLLLLLLL